MNLAIIKHVNFKFVTCLGYCLQRPEESSKRGDHDGRIVSIICVLNLPFSSRVHLQRSLRLINLEIERIMENAESTLETKLKQLKRTEDKTDGILTSGKQSTISRQLTNLKELLTEVENARRTVEGEKIAAEVSDDEISTWNDEINARIEEADGRIETLEEWLMKRKTEAENQEREEKMQFEIKLQETKLKLQENFQLKTGNQTLSAETPVSQAKLPKLVITKFNGTYADWPRFWGQYSESIDKTKFVRFD